MMEVMPAKSSAIISCEKAGNALYLQQAQGWIRLIPQKEGIVRVSFCDTKEFSTSQGDIYKDLSEGFEWTYETGNDEVKILTKKIKVIISMKTGAISYAHADGRLYLSERSKDSKQLESFDVYRTKIDEEARIEEVVTADGVKKVIHGAAQEFYKKMFHTKLALNFSEDEALYGLGQAEDGVLNLRGSIRYLFQANKKIALPLLISSRGYGILLTTQSTAVFEDSKKESFLYTQCDEMLDYFFIGGECMDDVIKGFRELSGKATMLPKWAFGYIQSFERYETEEELLKTSEEFREKKVGMDALVLDWISWEDNMWGQKTRDVKRFPDPASMMEKLHGMNTHFMLSIWPNMARQTPNFKEMSEAGFILPGSDIYNAYDEGARELYWKQAFEGWFKYGVDGWWCDSSEAITPEWNHRKEPMEFQQYYEFVTEAGKVLPLEKINSYGLYHAQGIYDGWRKVTSDKRVLNLTRCGYPGSQKYGTILWSGDISASWDTLKKQIAAGLNFCASGLPYWTLDIGAFFVKKGPQWYWDGEYPEGIKNPEYRELYTRWYQFGAFLPMFRSHGTDCRREPWQFNYPEDKCYDAILAANQLRYQLIPYIYSLAGAVWHEDTTIMRLLTFDFPEDKKVFDINDQYMFGPSFMVCPITRKTSSEESENVREIYLPAGTDWFDYWTNKRYTGGQTIKLKTTLEHIPLMVRAGSIIPMTDTVYATAETAGKPITLRVYPGSNGTFSLYEDAGDGYDYENGNYCITNISYDDVTHKVTLETEGNKEYQCKDINIQMIQSI